MVWQIINVRYAMNNQDKVLWVPDLAQNFNFLLEGNMPTEIVHMMADSGQLLTAQIKKEAKASIDGLKAELAAVNFDNSTGLYESPNGEVFISQATF
jgi:hypothetical protein